MWFLLISRETDKLGCKLDFADLIEEWRPKLSYGGQVDAKKARTKFFLGDE